MGAEWLVQVAAAGGSAFAGAAATDAWRTARDGVARLFGRGGPARQEAVEELADRTAAEIQNAPADAREQVREQWAQTWQQQLAALLDEYPEIGDELLAWAEQLRAESAAAQGPATMTFSSYDNSTQVNVPNGSVTMHLGENRRSP
ncbi:hypothetical protein ACFO1B_49565 [Dactylosporangium siamense]|uniref:Uncharacterized protein n=1 Tax=Dactylosporangium siamense TaxID=685454 RepID=A0A919PWC0_9ACTN|nr:hypothetical protein [Dactylosporangium siamense]GIG52005.1 hypothetical protein Dsi01nite_100460 [Dactylosporangium siamense]